MNFVHCGEKHTGVCFLLSLEVASGDNDQPHVCQELDTLCQELRTFILLVLNLLLGYFKKRNSVSQVQSEDF